MNKALTRLLELLNAECEEFTFENVHGVDVEMGKYYNVSTSRGDVDVEEITKEQYDEAMKEVNNENELDAFVDDNGSIVYDEGMYIRLI